MKIWVPATASLPSSPSDMPVSGELEWHFKQHLRKLLMLLSAFSQDFDTVMAAIRSHPSQRDVRLELQRCE